jgi:hypothetical protein
MLEPTLDLQKLRARLGGTVYAGGTRWLGPGPNHSKRDMSLSVRLDGSRPVIFSFASDSFVDCLRHLGLDGASLDKSPDREEYVKRQREREQREREDRRRKQAFCAGVWGETHEGAGSPVETYLREARKLPLAVIPTSLRFHPASPLAYPWSMPPGEAPATSPAMVALVSGPGGQGTGLHVTPLTLRGERARRKKLMFGSCIEGAVRLQDIGEDRHLAVGEGIETALAFGHMSNLPAWAALSTAGLRRFRAPAAVRLLTIAADSDDSGAGMAAATALAECATSRADCRIVAAPDGKDWADVLAEGGR